MSGVATKYIVLAILTLAAALTIFSEYKMIWAFLTFPCFQRQMFFTYALGLPTYRYAHLSQCIYPTYLRKCLENAGKDFLAFSEHFKSLRK